ncbi:L-aspartate 1-decarboxylase [Reichenbachiella agariperforans]|uniref:Aspartate 1-decarboxylase n=2 Tax=Reichenbachiellaceae TaxID=2762302 RepID=A0A1M6NCU1_REIAG|nr:L-aspartate 1-decarboxylase [Reichenbachiella agariperforans]
MRFVNNIALGHNVSAEPYKNDLIMRWMMRSKIHKAVVTEANLNYVGSITIDKDFLDMVGLKKGEKVQIVSNTSGARLETYVIEGDRGSKEICMNGAASHLIGEGEEIIIIGYELTNEDITPSVILLDKDNNFVEYLEESVELNRFL